MYAKLSIDNAKKSIKDYLIYFITMTICVSLFYAFLSLSSSEYELITEDTYNFEVLKAILKYSTYIITLVLIILIAYVNKYIMKRRFKEFATYILLGLEQKNVSIMFFIEMLIVSILSIICGVVLGVLFSQVVTAIIYNSINQEVVFEFRFYLDTLVITFVFFISMYFVIGIYNSMYINKLKLIDMLNIQKQSEFKFKKSKTTYFIIFLLSVFMYFICGLFTYKFVILKDFSNFEALNMTLASGVILISFIIGTYSFFYSISYIIILVKEKYLNIKYEGTNLFLIGSIVSKIKTTPILISSISISFLGALISFVLVIILSLWSVGYLDNRVPFDIAIRSDNYLVKDLKDLPKLDYKEVIIYLKEKGYNIKDLEEVEKYIINKEELNKEPNMKKPLAISLSDFNKMRKMLGYKEIKLKENEYTTQWYNQSNQEDINKYIKENKTITVDNKNLKLSQNSYYIDSLDEGLYNFYTEYTALIVLPDNICKNLSVLEKDFFAMIDKDMSYDDASEFEYEFIPSWFKNNNKEFIKKYENTHRFVYSRIKSAETNEILNSTLGMRIVGMYLGIILFMISLTILSLQQLTDSIEHKDRFNVLRKLGIEENDINKIVLKQVGIYFLLPIFFAVVGFTIFMYVFYELYKDFLTVYVKSSVLVSNLSLAITVVLILYTLYFLGTYYTFKRNIR